MQCMNACVESVCIYLCVCVCDVYRVCVKTARLWDRLGMMTIRDLICLPFPRLSAPPSLQRLMRRMASDPARRLGFLSLPPPPYP